MLYIIMYWINLYDSKKFPFFSYDLYDKYGQLYNISKIVEEDGVTFYETKYENYSPVYSSIMFTIMQGFTFAMVTAPLSEFVIFHGIGR